MKFNELDIIPPILKALDELGYETPSPIQEQAIPILLRKKDLLGCAQTGTGKTAAFAIPILQHIYLDRNYHKKKRRIRALVVTPTRELAIQIGESFSRYGKFTGVRNTVVFGGVKQNSQVKALQAGVDILVATPGRLLDLMGQGFINLKDVEFSVLDEADHMLDMGFINDIKKIVNKLPEQRQSLFFSATMPPEIMKLSKIILGNPEKITIKPEQATAEKVEQALYYVAHNNKVKLLIHLMKQNEVDSVLVFSRTKHGANKIVKKLITAGYHAAAIHGNKSQNARQKVLAEFKNKQIKILVATDIAARGIDVSNLELVVNYDLPNVSETYIHRIGRTGRASASGVAVSFCDLEERAYLREIEKLIKQKITLVKDHPFYDDTQKTDIIPKKPKSVRGKPQRRRKPTPKKRSDNSSKHSKGPNPFHLGDSKRRY